MVARSGLGRMHKRYYYYVCPIKECNRNIPANEIEGVILEEIKMLSLKKEILNKIVELTNKKLEHEIPHIKEERSLLVRELEKERDAFQRIAYSNQLGQMGPYRLRLGQRRLRRWCRRREWNGHEMRRHP